MFPATLRTSTNYRKEVSRMPYGRGRGWLGGSRGFGRGRGLGVGLVQGLARGRGFGPGIGRGRGNPYSFCRFYPWLSGGGMGYSAYYTPNPTGIHYWPYL